MTSAVFKVELQRMQALLSQQSASLSPSQLNKLTTLQADAFATRAAQLRDINIGEVADMTTTIQNGPWPAAEQQKLIMALANALAGIEVTGTPSSGKSEKRPSQILSHFQNYTTSHENGKLSDPETAMTVKIEIVLDTLTRIQAVLLNEPSKRHVLATVCAAHSASGWTAEALRGWYVSFKKEYTTRFKHKKADPSIGHLRQFPERPNLLPDTKFDIMFDGTTPDPMQVELHTVATIEKHIWCRGDAVALRHDAPAVANRSSATLAMPMDVNNPMQAMMSMMNMMMMRQHAGQELPIQYTPPGLPKPGAPLRAGSSCSLRAIEDAPKPSTESPMTPKPSTESEPPHSSKKNSSTLTPQQQADRFLLSLQGKEPDDNDTDDDDPATVKTAKGKGKAKGKAKANKAKAKAKAKSKDKPKTTVKPTVKGGALIFNPTCVLESTRSQYLCRPGLTYAESGESSKAFPFSQYGGKGGALKAGMKWVKDFKATHKCK